MEFETNFDFWGLNFEFELNPFVIFKFYDLFFPPYSFDENPRKCEYEKA